MPGKLIALACVIAWAGCVVEAPGYEQGDEPTSNENGVDLGDGSITPDIAGCSAVTTVILYSEDTDDLALPRAFAANADRCTKYYVNLPALSNDKTEPRATVAAVHALGPNFYATAEFSWGAWRDWIAQSPGTRDWATAGKQFRERMAAAGYDVNAGDTWAINEFPASTRTGDNDVWQHERAAVMALATGDGGNVVQGVVFLAGMGQTLQDTSVYKSNMEGWLRQTPWWNDMASYVRSFAYEVYADPHDSCAGSNVMADMEHLDAYLEHLPRLAKAGGAESATAAAYLAHHYVPLVSAAFNSNSGFGDNQIPLAAFLKYARLQVFASHYWAAYHGYPGRRLGFAYAPKDATPDQLDSLTKAIAGAMSRAYPANRFWNLAKYACSTGGSLDGCGCQVNGSFNPAWSAFDSW